MRQFRAYHFAVLVVLFLTPKLIKAEEEAKPWHVDTSVSFLSDYMFRGFNLYPGSSIQPSITGGYDTGYGEVSANLWMHISAEGGGTDKPEPFTEIDETLRYTYATEEMAFSVGLAWYTYPDSDDDIASTGEAFASIAFNGLVNPVFSVYHDYDEFDAQYYELGFSHTFEEVADGVSLTPYVGFGFASNSEKLYADDGFVQTTTGLSLSVPVGEVSLVPSVNYTFEADDNAVNQFWFGFAVNYSF